MSIKKGAVRVFHWTLALALLPTAWAAVKVLVVMVPSVAAEGFRSWWLYLAGALIYLSCERLLVKPMSIYVFGHELTHVIAGVVSGAKIHSFKSSSKGGEVRLSKTNPLIALAPYIIPLYTLFVIALYATIKHWWMDPKLVYGFKFLLGVTLAFHISMTISAIHGNQPDLKMLGFFLSGVLIALINTMIVGLLCVSLFVKTPTFRRYVSGLSTETIHAWNVTIDVATRFSNRYLTRAYAQSVQNKWHQFIQVFR